jgi:hypothetical protein
VNLGGPVESLSSGTRNPHASWLALLPSADPAQLADSKIDDELVEHSFLRYRYRYPNLLQCPHEGIIRRMPVPG